MRERRDLSHGEVGLQVPRCDHTEVPPPCLLREAAAPAGVTPAGVVPSARDRVGGRARDARPDPPVPEHPAQVRRGLPRGVSARDSAADRPSGGRANDRVVCRIASYWDEPPAFDESRHSRRSDRGPERRLQRRAHTRGSGRPARDQDPGTPGRGGGHPSASSAANPVSARWRPPETASENFRYPSAKTRRTPVNLFAALRSADRRRIEPARAVAGFEGYPPATLRRHRDSGGPGGTHLVREDA
jgi:hypothetical protein